MFLLVLRDDHPVLLLHMAPHVGHQEDLFAQQALRLDRLPHVVAELEPLHVVLSHVLLHQLPLHHLITHYTTA